MALTMSTSSALWSSVPIHVVDFEGSARTGVVEFGVARGRRVVNILAG